MQIPELNIETQRLLLRLPERDDFDAYAEMIGDEETARYIGGQMTRSAAWRKFLQMPGAWAMQGYAMFSVCDKGTGEWLGQCGPWQPEGWPGTEVGWAFKRSAWGKGYAREAAVVDIDPVADAVLRQLLDAMVAAMVAQIGQDDDVGALGQRRQRFGGAGDQGLALHLGGKEFVEHRPDPLMVDRATIGMGHGDETARFMREGDVVALA